MDKEKKVIEMYLEGIPTKNICKENDIDRGELYKILGKNNIKSNRLIIQGPIKYCTSCGVELNDSNWYPSYKECHTNKCKNCCLDYSKNNLLRTCDLDGKIIIIRCEKREFPKGNECELCNKVSDKLHYHHWDKQHPEDGLWECYWCHMFSEAIEHGLTKEYFDKYEELKKMVERKEI